MAQITVLSLNMQGVSATDIANAMTTIKPDLVALQEAPASSNQFYNDLSTALGASKPYDMTGPIREYPSPPPSVSGHLLDAQGTMKQVVVFYKKATMTLLSPLALVDFLTDTNIVKPKTVEEARNKGFAARPPAYCRFKQGTNYIGLFVWHAPTKTDAAHVPSLEHFNSCKKLDNACTNNHLTILAGDFNDDKLTNYFSDFQHGIQHKFDYVLGDNVNKFEDLLKGAHKGLLNGLCTTTQDHFAMGICFDY